MFDFNNLPEKQEFKKRPFIRPGVQTLILKDIFLQVSPNTANERPVFSMETEPITDEEFVPHQDAKYGGQIGNVSGNFGYYLKNENQKLEFIGNLRDIMRAVGTYDDFMNQHGKVTFGSLDQVIEVAKPFLVGTKARYFVAGEQYQKLDKTGIGLKLKFPSRKLVESLDSETKFPKFDETNSSHFKKLEKTVTPAEVPNDLPF